MNAHFLPMCLVALLTVLPNPRGFAQEKSGDIPPLEIKEKARIRAVIYSQGIITSTRETEAGLPFRVVTVPKELKRLHERKRVATLKVLLDIVRGGRPKDALTAAAYAIAMEEDAIAAVSCVDASPDTFDEDVGQLGDTYRDRLVAWLETTLAKLEEKNKGKSK